MGYFSSGNAAVDMMGTVSIKGNIIPQEWYKQIIRPNGKPYLLAISLLSDIVYWYRPNEVRDEQSGNVIGWQKRFKGDYLQKSYEQYAVFFGESKRSIKAAIDYLIELGVIGRIFRDIRYKSGMKLYNVMYITLDPVRLQEITFPEESGVTEKQPDNNLDGNEISEIMSERNDSTSEDIPDDAGGGTKLCMGSDDMTDGAVQKNVQPLSIAVVNKFWTRKLVF